MWCVCMCVSVCISGMCMCVWCVYVCVYVWCVCVYSEGGGERDCLGTNLEDSSYCSHKETKRGSEAQIPQQVKLSQGVSQAQRGFGGARVRIPAPNTARIS